MKTNHVLLVFAMFLCLTACRTVPEVSEYTITYDLKGGTMAGNVNPSVYTGESDIPLAAPGRNAYTFAGWNITTESGEALPQARGDMIAAGASGNLLATATWAPAAFAITYDLDGGALDADEKNPLSYTAETNSFTLYAPKKAGCDFLGWYEDGDSENAVVRSVTIKKGSRCDKKYIARYSKTAIPVGLATERQKALFVYGKDGIPRPDWVIMLPLEEGYHYERGYAKGSDFYASYKEAVSECIRAYGEWEGVTVNLSIGHDGTGFNADSSTITSENPIQNRIVVEYWEESDGGVWVLMKVPQK